MHWFMGIFVILGVAWLKICRIVYIAISQGYSVATHTAKKAIAA
jgi:hypothetical protein